MAFFAVDLSWVLDHFSYIGIFILLVASGAGAPYPEELPIIAAGVLSRQGHMIWWIALPVTVVAALAGDCIIYLAGYHWGYRLLEHRWMRFFLPLQRQQKVREYFDEYGDRILFIARFTYGFRAAAYLTAGALRVSFWRFLLIDGLAALVSIPVLFSLGYLFTDRLEMILEGVHRLEHWLIVVAVVAVFLFIIYHYYFRRAPMLPLEHHHPQHAEAPRRPGASEPEMTGKPTGDHVPDEKDRRTSGEGVGTRGEGPGARL